MQFVTHLQATCTPNHFFFSMSGTFDFMFDSDTSRGGGGGKEMERHVRKTSHFLINFTNGHVGCSYVHVIYCF